MEDQTSDQVVIPDITEPLTNESESNENLPSEEHQTVSVTAVEAVPVSSSVPVSLPVGSLINVSGSGTTFNVITPDQLQVSYLDVRCLESFLLICGFMYCDLKQLLFPFHVLHLRSPICYFRT